MKALSIRQPWCWAILFAGKDVENRGWKRWNPARKFRGQFLIHASQGMTRHEYKDALDDMHRMSRTRPFPPGLTLPAFDDLPRGGIVGMARVVDILMDSPSPWFFGPMALQITDAQPLPFVPFKGSLGFFDVPDSLMTDDRTLPLSNLS